MATSGHGQGQSTGQPGGQDTTATGGGASGAGPAAGGPVGHVHVDTTAVDAASRRYLVVEGDLARVASHVDALTSYRPTSGGRDDATWNSFLSSGYQEAAQSFSQIVRSMVHGLTDTAEGLRAMSKAYADTEAANTRAAADLQRAFTQGG